MSLIAPYKSHVSGDAKLTRRAARYIPLETMGRIHLRKTLVKLFLLFCRDVIGIHYVPAVRQGVHYLPVGNNYMEENLNEKRSFPVSVLKNGK